MTMLQKLKKNIRFYSNIHMPGAKPNVFIFSTPRSGSTWLMELLRTQPGFKSCEEPLNLRNPDVQQYFGSHNWCQLYDETVSKHLHAYFEGFCNGTIRFMNGNPFNTHNRFITNRIVFKVLHGGEDRINWFAEQFNGRIILLLRHPLAVSISRETFPRLETFLNSDYQKHLTKVQKELGIRIIQNGTHLEKGVFSWCLQNAIPLKHATDKWSVITYEQMVLEPRPLIHYLAKKLQLPKPEQMLTQLQKPSASYHKSNEETKMLLNTNQPQKRQKVINKWRKRVDEKDGISAMNILKSFGLDIYSYAEDLPEKKYWIGSE